MFTEKDMQDLIVVYKQGRWKLPGFKNFAFPVVRRVFPKLLSHEIVSVQPMSLPTGLLFYLDYQYGSGSKGK